MADGATWGSLLPEFETTFIDQWSRRMSVGDLPKIPLGGYPQDLTGGSTGHMHPLCSLKCGLVSPLDEKKIASGQRA
jgi:hypothetical protein